MSLSSWERQVLDSIRERLARSDPKLVALLTMFTRLASGEEMPAREGLRVASRRSVRRRRHRGGIRRRALDRGLGLPRVAVLLWLVITVAMCTTALALSGGGQSRCAMSWAAVCARSNPGGPG